MTVQHGSTTRMENRVSNASIVAAASGGQFGLDDHIYQRHVEQEPVAVALVGG